MNLYEEKIKEFMKVNGINAEHLVFEKSCHSVAEAAAAVNAEPSDFVKSICMINSSGLIVGIVLGDDRASTSRIAKSLNIDQPRIASPEEVLEMTGYPIGGVPAFGYDARFLVDERVMEKEIVYSGGGSSQALTKISPKEMVIANKGEILKIRK